jgi:hypothetical protein
MERKILYKVFNIFWRNIGYLKNNGEIVVIVLDLHPKRVFREETGGTWINRAIERLKTNENCEIT